MDSEHDGVSSFCALCGVPSCISTLSYPARLQDGLDWTHDIVHPESLALGFVLHSACWKIFLSQYHSLEGKIHLPESQLVLFVHAHLHRTRKGKTGAAQLPFVPDWCEKFADPIDGKGPADARFPDGWVEDYWEMLDNTKTTEPNNTMDFLLVSPLAVEGGSIWPMRRGSELDERAQRYVAFHSSVPDLCPHRRDLLSILPLELWNHIQTFLPTQSVASLRNSSRDLAETSMDQSFWSSRFAYPHEMSLISPSGVAQTEGSSSWWRCYHTAYWRADTLTSNHHSTKNFRRVRHCCKRLAQLAIEYRIASLVTSSFPQHAFISGSDTRVHAMAKL